MEGKCIIPRARPISMNPAGLHPLATLSQGNQNHKVLKSPICSDWTIYLSKRKEKNRKSEKQYLSQELFLKENVRLLWETESIVFKSLKSDPKVCLFVCFLLSGKYVRRISHKNYQSVRENIEACFLFHMCMIKRKHWLWLSNSSARDSFISASQCPS